MMYRSVAPVPLMAHFSDVSASLPYRRTSAVLEAALALPRYDGGSFRLEHNPGNPLDTGSPTLSAEAFWSGFRESSPGFHLRALSGAIAVSGKTFHPKDGWTHALRHGEVVYLYDANDPSRFVYFTVPEMGEPARLIPLKSREGASHIDEIISRIAPSRYRLKSRKPTFWEGSVFKNYIWFLPNENRIKLPSGKITPENELPEVQDATDKQRDRRIQAQREVDALRTTMKRKAGSEFTRVALPKRHLPTLWQKSNTDTLPPINPEDKTALDDFIKRYFADPSGKSLSAQYCHSLLNLNHALRQSFSIGKFGSNSDFVSTHSRLEFRQLRLTHQPGAKKPFSLQVPPEANIWIKPHPRLPWYKSQMGIYELEVGARIRFGAENSEEELTLLSPGEIHTRLLDLMDAYQKMGLVPEADKTKIREKSSRYIRSMHPDLLKNGTEGREFIEAKKMADLIYWFNGI